MGRDAVVFRNVRSLEGQFGEGLFEVDEHTGGASPKPGHEVVGLAWEDAFAANIYLGNSATVVWLRLTIESILGTGSFIVERVLSAGVRCGDKLELHELPRLCEELDVLRTKGIADLLPFVESMESLVTAAKREHNPIVLT